MLWPNVVGQSGTASAAPVFVTSPPKRIRTNVATTVVSARRCATGQPSVPAAPRRYAARLGLGQEIFAGIRDAVLVRTAVDGRDRRAPVQVRRRRGGRPLERGRVPRVQRSLRSREERPEEVDDERDLRDPEEDGTVRDEHVP